MKWVTTVSGVLPHLAGIRSGLQLFDVGGAGHRVIETPPLQPNIGIPHAISLSIVRFAKYHL